MTYQEKVAKAEECFELILSGKSFVNITEKLTSEGFYQYDISKIMVSLTQMLDQKFGKDITSDIHHSTYADSFKYGIHNEVYQEIKNNQIKKIRDGITYKISRLVGTTKNDNDILTAVSSSFFTDAEVLDKIKRAREKHVAPPSDGINSTGNASIIGGLLITAVFLIGGRISLWGIILVGHGIYKKLNKSNNDNNYTRELDEIGKE
ncbi:MAG TPA: hypothetical protein PKD51_08540 [Saprospiraceae bacterium]|nr:hypothetical protein [Saprospiraceae bacterium]HMU02888.1 hypothetical protein [Saprospiraceae bacterium]